MMKVKTVLIVFKSTKQAPMGEAGNSGMWQRGLKYNFISSIPFILGAWSSG